MNKAYKTLLPEKYHDASYERDVSETVKNVTKKQINKREGIYLWGDSGCGKTHIACAIAKQILENGIDIMFLNTGDFLERIREEYNKVFEDGEEGIFREVMNFKGVLFLDDIGAEKVSEWTRERLYLIINKKWEDMTPIVFTSNCDLEILSARMGDRITSRISGMTTRIKVEGNDRRLKENGTK